MKLILASASPRRRELLSLITTDFEIRVSDAEEKAEPALSPAETVQALAKRKGDAVYRSAAPDEVVLAADTLVYLDGAPLGKPHGEAQAFDMLHALSGRTHEVYTGVYIRSAAREISFAACTQVEFYPLTDEEILAYIATGEPFDKAGGYGIQSKGALLVKGIRGDYANVVGFPVARAARALREFGFS